MKRNPKRIQPSWSRSEPELFNAPNLGPAAIPVNPCASCGAPYAPFGVGFPKNTVWFCRLHIGGTILEDIDRNRCKEVMRRSTKAAMQWLYMYEAAGRGEEAEMKRLWEQIRTVSVEASDILKALGAKKDERVP